MKSQYKLPRMSRSGWGKLLVGAGLIALAVSAGAAPDPLVTGCGLLSTGKVAAATAQFTRALAQNPRCAEAYVGWALALLRQGQLDTALQAFQSALALNPDSVAAHLGQAGVLALQGHWPQAEAEYALVVAAGGPGAVDAAAGEAWALCAEGNYGQALTVLAHQAGAADTALGAYVQAAAQFAASPADATLASDLPPAAPGGLGLGSCLSGSGMAWARQSDPSLVNVPPPSPAPAAALPTSLHILTPTEGAALRGPVPLRLAGEAPGATYVLARVGGRFAGMSDNLSFLEPLDTTAWPGGEQELTVVAYDGSGHSLGRGAVHVNVLTPDLTLAEPAPASDPWAVRELTRRVAPEPLPGVVEQLRGEIAWRQNRLTEAQAHLVEAFRTDPYLPRVRQELLTVSQALGLPILQGGAKLVHVPVADKAIALTFDDGPHPKLTPLILNQLDRYGAHATFFVVGKQVEMYPDLAREIVARGDELGCHTWSHMDLTDMTQLDVEREIVTGRQVTAAATGKQAIYFRPPGGDYDGQVAQAAQLWGFTPVFWTCDICDFYKNPPSHVVAGIMRHLHPGGILLLHNGEDLTIQILPELLEALKAEGYRMVSVGELAATRNQTVAPGTTPAE